MPLTGEYEPSTLDWARKNAEEIMASGGTQGMQMRGMAVILLTTIGAKTGTLNGVNALSGFLETASGKTLIFSAYSNDRPSEAPSAIATLDAALVDGVDIVDPDGHPHAPVLAIVHRAGEGRGVLALAAASLAVQAKEDLALARAHRAEARRAAPVPALAPAEFREPFEGFGEVGDVENRGQT